MKRFGRGGRKATAALVAVAMALAAAGTAGIGTAGAATSGRDRLAADLVTLARRLGDIPLEELRPYRAAAAE